eukprot:2197026-Pyramimonas_sp.AAC.3
MVVSQATRNGDRESIQHAVHVLESTIQHQTPRPDPDFMFHVGYGYQELLKLSKATIYLDRMIASFETFMQVARASDARRAQVVAILQHYHR